MTVFVERYCGFCDEPNPLIGDCQCREIKRLKESVAALTTQLEAGRARREATERVYDKCLAESKEDRETARASIARETARADAAVAEAKALRERIAMAADDFNPEGSNDAELALSEMRDFLRATLAQPAADGGK